MPPGSTSAETIVGVLIALAVVFHAVWIRTVTLRGWVLVDGTVAGFVARPFDGEGGPSTLDHPVISTRLPNGQTLTFEADMASEPNPWAVGDAVLVRVKGEMIKLHSPSFFTVWHFFGLTFAAVMVGNGQGYYSHVQP